MIEVLSKPADEIDIHDIQRLIELEVPEGEQIEFKETLPANGPEGDPWVNGTGSIGNRAKTAILEEVVAFSNAHGGVLVLGVQEWLGRRLAERAELFQREFQRLHTPKDAYGVRLTGAPVGDDVRMDRVFRDGRLAREFDEPWHPVV